VNKVSVIDRARTAMAVDCEGTIGVYMKKNWDGSPGISVRVSICNTWIPFLEDLKRIWGIGYIHGENTSFPNRKDRFDWQIGKRDHVKSFLKSVQRHLLIKRPQAFHALKAISYLEKCTKRRYRRKNRRFSEEERQKIRELVMEAHALNGRAN